MLFKGQDGIAQDILKAIEVCREAADLGNADAIRNLPIMIAHAGNSH
jgi:TPR repeat protein